MFRVVRLCLLSLFTMRKGIKKGSLGLKHESYLLMNIIKKRLGVSFNDLPNLTQKPFYFYQRTVLSDNL